jgi:hypothetical protein
MMTCFPKPLQRLLLSAFAFATTIVIAPVIAPQLQVTAQGVLSRPAIPTTPQRIPDSNQAAAGICAFYFKDFDGHNLAIIYFPPGKGDPKWQKPTNQTFLGIDHTAVKNVEAIGDQLRLNQATFISPSVVAIPGQALGFKTGILVRNPDGHPLRLIEK